MNTPPKLLKFDQDKTLDFQAIICLQNDGRGPAIGGCRLVEYSSLEVATEDAIRLSQAMSYKAAISELPHNGGKAVIIRPKQIKDRTAFWTRFAEFVNSQQGQYITTIDSGTSAQDMAIIKQTTPYVTGFIESDEEGASAATALGVFKAMQAAIKLKYNQTSMSGLQVAIQGVGKVGYLLAKLLFQAGVELTVSDINSEQTLRAAREFNATVVLPQDIYQVKCDIFSPCALGRMDQVPTHASIIAGAANDQLQSSLQAHEFDKRGIFYLPDFVINAGGLIYLSLQSRGINQQGIEQEVVKIYDRILNFSEIAKAQQISLYEFAERKAKALLA